MFHLCAALGLRERTRTALPASRARGWLGDRPPALGAIKVKAARAMLSRKPVASVSRDDVEAFMHDVAAGKTVGRRKTKPRGVSVVRVGRGVATRTVGLLGAIFSYAVRRGYRIDNPAHGIVRFADGRRQRRLTDAEYRQLATALNSAKVWQPAIAATWLMVLTGWRRGEVLGLRWSEIDLARRTARLVDTKTGTSMRALSEKACAVTRSQPQNLEWVFPSRSGEQIIGYRKMWLKIAVSGGLPADVTPHVLRHSFASLAADMGYSEPTIAALIGHKNHSTTSRYLHSADAVLLAAADAVATETWRLMGSPVIGGISAQMDQQDGNMWDELTFL